MDIKRCNACELDLPLTEFYKRKIKSKDKTKIYECWLHICKKCEKKRATNARERRYALDPDVKRREDRVAADKKQVRRYGITPEDYVLMLEKQNRRCKSCGEELRSGREVHLDHSHDTGRVRGILCNRCNLALGLLAESYDRATKLAAYIKEYC